MTKRKHPSRKAGQPKPPIRNAPKSVRNSWTSPDRVRREERKRVALDYRKQGYSYTEIAKLMKEPMNTVYDLVVEALKAITREPAEQLLELELARVDTLLKGVYKDASKGNDTKIASSVRLMDKRHRLLGLDRATLELTGKDGGPIETKRIDLTDAERARALAAFIAKVKASKGGE